MKKLKNYCNTNTITASISIGSQVSSLTYKASTNQIFAVYSTGIAVGRVGGRTSAGVSGASSEARVENTRVLAGGVVRIPTFRMAHAFEGGRRAAILPPIIGRGRRRPPSATSVPIRVSGTCLRSSPHLGTFP